MNSKKHENIMTGGQGSVLWWWLYDMSRISAFVGDVISSHNWS